MEKGHVVKESMSDSILLISLLTVMNIAWNAADDSQPASLGMV